MVVTNTSASGVAGVSNCRPMENPSDGAEALVGTVKVGSATDELRLKLIAPAGTAER